MAVRLLIAGDHTISQAILSSWLGGLPGIEVVGVARTSRIAVDLTRLLRADVILIDDAMVRQAGAETLRRAFLNMPGLRILVLSDDAEACPGPSNHQPEIGQRISTDCSLNDLAKLVREGTQAPQPPEIAWRGRSRMPGPRQEPPRVPSAP